MNPRELLEQRLLKRKSGWLDIRTELRHFALINYAVPKARLTPHLPQDRFEIPEFEINGRQRAMLSVVPFVDANFRFYRIAPWFKFHFPQTNHRLYVIDKQDNQPVVWFLGTTLGSGWVKVARALWRIPWHQAGYESTIVYDESARKYSQYQLQIDSAWCRSVIDIEDSGDPVHLSDEERLILTHPVEGFYYRNDGRVGGYAIWHEEIPLTTGHPRHLYFSLYEDLGIMSRDEMQQPHSIFICPVIEFDIYMPPG